MERYWVGLFPELPLIRVGDLERRNLFGQNFVIYKLPHKQSYNNSMKDASVVAIPATAAISYLWFTILGKGADETEKLNFLTLI